MMEDVSPKCVPEPAEEIELVMDNEPSKTQICEGHLSRVKSTRGQLVPGMRKGIGVCQCFGHIPIDGSLPHVKRTRHVGYNLFAQIIRNRVTNCLVHDRSDVDEGEGSA
jgi:hypothetical protein